MEKSEQRKREFIKIAYYIYPGPVTVLDLLYSNSMPGLLEQNRQERSINKCK